MSVRLFVGNLPFDVTEAEIREFFSPVGELQEVFLPVDRESGKPRGFAFIEFDEASQAAEAVRRFNEQQFKGRALSLSEARAREKRSFGDSFSRMPAFEARSASGAPAAADAAGYSGDAYPDDVRSRKEKRGRNFGPDAKPKRARKQAAKPSKFEGKKKGPLRPRVGGQVYGLSGDDFYDEIYDSEYDVD